MVLLGRREVQRVEELSGVCVSLEAKCSSCSKKGRLLVGGGSSIAPKLLIHKIIVVVEGNEHRA